MGIRGALALALLYIVVPFVQIWTYIAGLPFADPIDILNYGASIAAYHWLLSNVLLGLKLPIFQNWIPYDTRIRLHVWTTMGITAFVVWHGVYTIFLKAKLIDLVTWSLLGVFGLLLLMSLLWIPLPGLKAVRARMLTWFRWGILKSYDWMKASHKVLFFVLAGLTYWHLLLADLGGEIPDWSYALYIAQFAVAAAAFLWTRLHNLTLPELEVASVVFEGGIVRVALAGHPRLNYKSGQFAFLRFRHPELRGEEHPFSFTSARHEDHVGFAVRALGDYTAKLALLKAGDKVRVNGGFGAFHPQNDQRPLALIGSGIGAAPLVSILKEVAQKDPNREVICLLAVGTRAELLEPAVLVDLQAQMPRLTLKTFVFQEDGKLYGPDLLKAEIGEPGKYQYYLCSSDKVRGILVSALKGLGVPGRRIHFEAFNLG